MKSIKLVVLSALVAGLQVSVAQANAFPSSGEAEDFVMPAPDSYAERMARLGDTTGADVWGVSPRRPAPHDPFPFGGGPVDD